MKYLFTFPPVLSQVVSGRSILSGNTWYQPGITRLQQFSSISIFPGPCKREQNSLFTKFIKNMCLLLGVSFCLNGVADPDLTVAERQWLNAHPVIRIAPGHDFQPFEWISKEGHYNGMVVDYIRLIEEELEIKFELIKSDSWSQTATLDQQHEVDVLPAIIRTDQSEKHMLFTRSYISVPGVLVSGLNHMGINQLGGHQVAIVRDQLWDERLTAANTGILIKRVDDLKFGLELTALGAVDAMITDLASAASMIERESLNSLHIMNDASQKLGNLDIAMAVRADWPELHSILNKALGNIGESDIKAIRSKWIRFREPVFWRDPDFWYYMLIFFALLLTLFSAFYIWNRTLKKQVALQTRKLHAAQLHLMQAEKMESVGHLAAGVAHEVKNPLAIIQMGVDYLSGTVTKDENTIRVIEDIDDAVQRANTVILGLLDFSRAKKLELKSAHINKVIISSLHLVQHELRQRSIKVQTCLADKLPLMALDTNKLQQVFVNLILNATHAIDRNGKIVITSELRLLKDKLTFEQNKDSIFQAGEQVIRVEIADSGPGIPEQDKAKIFDLFYTTKSVGEGTGLGLSVSRNIVKLHQGTINITNRFEGGAKVVLLFKLT